MMAIFAGIARATGRISRSLFPALLVLAICTDGIGCYRDAAGVSDRPRRAGGCVPKSKDRPGKASPIGNQAKPAPAVHSLRGAEFEQWLQKTHNGYGPFKKDGREFDGGIGSRWFEAKSGAYWKDHCQPGPGFDKFKSDVGSKARIAGEHGATIEIHSNSPIPKHVTDWLSRKNIRFFEY